MLARAAEGQRIGKRVSRRCEAEPGGEGGRDRPDGNAFVQHARLDRGPQRHPRDVSHLALGTAVPASGGVPVIGADQPEHVVRRRRAKHGNARERVLHFARVFGRRRAVRVSCAVRPGEMDDHEARPRGEGLLERRGITRGSSAKHRISRLAEELVEPGHALHEIRDLSARRVDSRRYGVGARPGIGIVTDARDLLRDTSQHCVIGRTRERRSAAVQPRPPAHRSQHAGVDALFERLAPHPVDEHEHRASRERGRRDVGVRRGVQRREHRRNRVAQRSEHAQARERAEGDGEDDEREATEHEHRA